MKCSERRKRLIIGIVEKENPTLSELCRRAGISWQTLKNWRAADPCFDAAFNGAEEAYLSNLKDEARLSLEKRVKGFWYEEERVEYEYDGGGNAVPVRKVVCRRYCPPDPKSVAMALRNADPANFE